MYNKDIDKEVISTDEMYDIEECKLIIDDDIYNIHYYGPIYCMAEMENCPKLNMSNTKEVHYIT